MWKILPQTFEILVEQVGGDIVVRLGLTDRLSSSIASQGFVRLDRLPTEWYEIRGMARFTGDRAGPEAVRTFCAKVFPVLFSVTDGRPVLFQCSRRHARFYVALFRRLPGYRITAVAGTMAGTRPLVDWSHPTGGSDDEQVLMLEITS